MVIENLTVKYRNARVLQPSTVRVPTAGVTALLGRNGTGKSSVFNALYGIYRAADLTISFDGVVVKKPYMVPGLMNYCSQGRCHPTHFTLFDLCASYQVSSDDFLLAYGMFNEYARSPLSDLSYGLSRLLVTLILLNAPVSYTVLDEPFSNIMPVHNEVLVKTINQVKQRKGVFISDHQYRTVLSVCDKLYLIVDERIRLLNSAGELITYGYVPAGTVL